MHWDDFEPTIEDEIRSNDELSPAQKKLLIQQSKVEFYRAMLILVLCLLLMGVIGVIARGWLLIVIDGTIFWGTVITYTLLENKKNHIEISLADESQNRQQIKSGSKKGKRKSLGKNSE